MFHSFTLAAADSGILNMATKTGSDFGVEWPLFLSQLVSFCIVAILLRKFAYQPILAVLEMRRNKIEESLVNAEKIKQQLAESEVRYQQILSKANTEAQRVIDEALTTAGSLGERERQKAISEAEQIIAKAREATALEHSQMLGQLKRELGRLVIDTTAKVTGKVLTAEDQQRLTEESTRGVSAV